MEAAVPVLLGLFVVWAVIVWGNRGNWMLPLEEEATGAVPPHDEPAPRVEAGRPQKVCRFPLLVFILFLLAPAPREVIALTAAGVLMLSRKLHSRKMLGLVDWQLLVLFVGLFVVNHALDKTGLTGRFVAEAGVLGVDIHQRPSRCLSRHSCCPILFPTYRP